VTNRGKCATAWFARVTILVQLVNVVTTWARKMETENQSLPTDSYNKIGKELGASVVPVGAVWQKLLAKHDKLVLHAEVGNVSMALHLPPPASIRRQVSMVDGQAGEVENEDRASGVDI